MRFDGAAGLRHSRPIGRVPYPYINRKRGALPPICRPHQYFPKLTLRVGEGEYDEILREIERRRAPNPLDDDAAADVLVYPSEASSDGEGSETSALHADRTSTVAVEEDTASAQRRARPSPCRQQLDRFRTLPLRYPLDGR